MIPLRFLLLPVFLAAGLAQPAFSDPLPADPGPSQEAGWIAYKRGDYNEAIRVYEELANVSPKDASLRYDLGCLYALKGRLPEAGQALLESIALNPHRALAYDALGQVFEQQDQPAVGRMFYAAAAELAPQDPKLLWHFARICIRFDDSRAASETLRQLLLFSPDHLDARYHLAVLELQAGNHEQSAWDFQAVLEQSPEHRKALNGLGLAYLRLGKTQEAAGILERAKVLRTEEPALGGVKQ